MPCDLDLLPLDVVFIGGRGIVTDYPCAKFGDFSFSRFDFIARTDRQTDRITDKHTDKDDCYTDATTHFSTFSFVSVLYHCILVSTK